MISGVFEGRREWIPSIPLSCDCCFCHLLSCLIPTAQRCTGLQSLWFGWAAICHFNGMGISFPKENSCGYDRLARSVMAVVSHVREGCLESLKWR